MAGRPSTKSTNTTTKSTVVEKVNTEIKNETNETDKLKQENEMLKSQLEQMMSMLNELKNTTSTTVQNNTESKVTTVDEDELDYVEIPSNKPIQVVSLSDGGVSLKTSNGSDATIFRFDKFGHKLTIINSDLEKVLGTNRSFIEDGTVYICDKQFVKNHYLEEIYKNFLTIDMMNNILNFDVNEIKSLVSNTTETIQESIISMLVNKINNNEYVDFNKIEAVGSACKKPCNIRDLAYTISSQDIKSE